MAPTIPIKFTGQKESRNWLVTQKMGKTRKVSKGKSSGFVPDYRHAVETISELEGFGSSGGVDTEMMTASENSCTPNRKCSVLNADGYDSFGVPMRVFLLSKMSSFERKDLELRLKMELEQVRIVQRKVASIRTNVAFLLHPSDIHSCSNGQKGTLQEGNQRLSAVSTKHGKKQVPPGRNKSRMKRGNSGKFESVKQAVSPNTSNPSLMKQCEALLKKLMSHQFGWVFNAPVNVVELNIPDYLTIIKHPMDLGTVKRKIASGKYSGPLDFVADVRLTFSNAMTYNPAGNNVYLMAEALGKFFEVRWKSMEKKLSVTTDAQPVPAKVAHVKTDTAGQMPPLKKKKVTARDNMGRPEAVRLVMTDKEKDKLSMEFEDLVDELPDSIMDFLKEKCMKDGCATEDNIEIHIETLSDDALFTLRKLLDDYLLEKQKHQAKIEACRMEASRQVMTAKEKDTLRTELENLLEELPDSTLDFLKEQCFMDGQTSDDCIEIDIDALSDDTLFTLRKLLDDYLLKKQENQAKLEPCRMELAHELKSSNSSGQPCKGGDKANEDIDIDGNDPPVSPVSNYPSLEIEKEADYKKGTCSRSSNTSSESGSSSSDSSSFSDIEAVAAKASIRVSAIEESLGSEANSDQKRSNVADPDIENQLICGLAHIEQDSQDMPFAFEAGHREGESAPSERQVSPEKLYRAALLRSRFADTILKAREKTLEEVEKRDPEKLQIEREVLERRQKEEKARLQAEAKAAEDTRRKAEAAAAAESKRKREHEREAARQALLEMEKTVDINENSQFMEDLQMLSAAPAVHLPSFIDEINSDQSENGLGSFKFQGSSNPLEQLGLFIKADDDDVDEDEEGEPRSVPDPKNDIEEGEID